MESESEHAKLMGMSSWPKPRGEYRPRAWEILGNSSSFGWKSGKGHSNLYAKLYSLDSHPMKDARGPYTDLNKVKIWLCLCIRRIILALVWRQFGGVRKESWGPCWNSVAMLTEQDERELNRGCE